MTKPPIRHLQFEVAVEITDPVAVRSMTLKTFDTDAGEAPSNSDPFAAVSEILRDRLYGTWQENEAAGFRLHGNTVSGRGVSAVPIRLLRADHKAGRVNLK